MNKRILSFLLAIALLFTVIPKLAPEAKAHKIVMTAEEFIDCLWTAHNRPNKYKNVYPYNLGYYDGSVIYFDCWNLGKAIIWSKGAIVNNYTVGHHASMDTSCGLGDWNGYDIIMEAPNCGTDFTNLVPGEWLYKDNHTGYYIGNGKVIECTAGWDVWKIVVSDIDKYGNRSYNGVSGGKWVYHGMVPWIDYSTITHTETWVEKACFDVMVYRDRNPDLADMTDAQLKNHWLNHGIKEGRASSTILDLGFYLANNPDLKEAFGTDYEKVYNHFITSGYKEHRKSSALFDGSYYTEKYPEVASSFGDEYLRHYVENGQAEGRRASLTFDPNYYWYIRPDVYEAWPDDYTMCARHYAGHGINAQVEAYDHIQPVISDVTISNVTAAGYTVSCKVTDDWGISKVVFPTWTLLNDQDDLADNFMNTQKGTKNGDTYTFTVNASDHGGETGSYVTHIYAVDKGGNTVKLALDTVDVRDPGLGEIVLTASAPYSMDSAFLYGVNAGTAVSSLLTSFENEVLRVVNAAGTVISGSAVVGTGTKINLYEGGVLVDTVTVIVLGDVDKNGFVDMADSSLLKAYLQNTAAFDSIQTLAADSDINDCIDSTDYLRIKSHVLGKFNLYA